MANHKEFIPASVMAALLNLGAYFVPLEPRITRIHLYKEHCDLEQPPLGTVDRCMRAIMSLKMFRFASTSSSHSSQLRKRHKRTRARARAKSGTETGYRHWCHPSSSGCCRSAIVLLATKSKRLGRAPEFSSRLELGCKLPAYTTKTLVASALNYGRVFEAGRGSPAGTRLVASY